MFEARMNDLNVLDDFIESDDEDMFFFVDNLMSQF